MTNRTHTRNWLAGTLVATALTLGAIASMTGQGVQIEAAGVEVTLQASFETGLKVVFAAL